MILGEDLIGGAMCLNFPAENSVDFAVVTDRNTHLDFHAYDSMVNREIWSMEPIWWIRLAS
jgi:hypothetical protein